MLEKVKKIHQTFSSAVTKGDKVFKNGPSKICGRQPLKNFPWSILECFLPKGAPSGSGRMIYEHYDFLTDIYSTSVPVKPLPSDVGAIHVNSSSDRSSVRSEKKELSDICIHNANTQFL